MICFRTNPEKALEVILWAAERRSGIDFHTILKVLFFADKYHLNRYGRPVVGDLYKALAYGPVAQTTYDILKGEPLAYELLGLDELPFEVRHRFRVYAKRSPALRKLSESDIEALEHAWQLCANLNFDARTGFSHDDKAYIRAVERGSQNIRYEDFLDEDADLAEKLDDLRETAHRLVI